MDVEKSAHPGTVYKKRNPELAKIAGVVAHEKGSKPTEDFQRIKNDIAEQIADKQYLQRLLPLWRRSLTKAKKANKEWHFRFPRFSKSDYNSDETNDGDDR